jgi:molybdenum cofactor cytidylyltransferase
MEPAAPIAAILLAAGLSRRWGADNKLLAPIRGTPMVALSAAAILASAARPAIVVLGHEDAAVRRALAGMAVSFQPAADYVAGLSASLKAGIAAVPGDCAGTLICLADMPWVRPATLDRLIGAFDPAGATLALVPSHEGQRGNPVLLGRGLFAEIARLSGDRGARSLLATKEGRVEEIAVDDPGILRDADRPAALLDSAGE